MKTYIIKLIVFALIILGLLNIYGAFRLYVTYTDPWGKYALILNGSEVFKSINKSKRRKKVKKLIIGDSVAEQIYSANDYNDSIYSLSCNQSITLAGHYCLLNNFLSINTDQLPDEVILYYNPFSLSTNLDRFAFHYFLKTFYYSGDYNELLFEKCISNRVREIPNYWLAFFPLTKSINYSPTYELPNENKGKWCSPITLCYIEKICNLCKEHDIPLRIESSFVREDRKEELELLFKEENTIIKNFASTIQYRPNNEFIDKIHFKHEFIPKDPLKISHENK